jgi:hypothetical protein
MLHLQSGSMDCNQYRPLLFSIYLPLLLRLHYYQFTSQVLINSIISIIHKIHTLSLIPHHTSCMTCLCRILVVQSPRYQNICIGEASARIVIMWGLSFRGNLTRLNLEDVSVFGRKVGARYLNSRQDLLRSRCLMARGGQRNGGSSLAFY